MARRSRRRPASALLADRPAAPPGSLCRATCGPTLVGRDARAAPPRGMIDPVERREDVPRSVDPAADLDYLPVAAARASRPTRVGPQFLPPKDERRLALHDLDRGAAHAARIGGCRKPILVGTRAGAAIRCHRHGESVVTASARLGLAAHVEIPQT